MNADLSRLEIFFGDANAAETRVYARLPIDMASEGLSLAGKLAGPFCVYAQTLPATIPLVDQGPGGALLAQAIVPDPCFWSPELPMLYNAHVELRRGAQVLARADRTLGIRPLAARGQRLVYEGKTWVLRGVDRQMAPHAMLEQWRETDTAMLVWRPDDDLCQQASRMGVLLAVDVSGTAAEAAERLHKLSRWAAVGMAIVSCSEPLPADLRRAARNLLLVQPLAGASQVEPWAQAIVLGEEDARRGLDMALPCIVRASHERSMAVRGDLARARKECDALQRDLAALGQFAGYLV